MYYILGDLEVWFKRWNLQVESYKEWQVTMLKVKWAVQTIGAQTEKRECSLRAKGCQERPWSHTCMCAKLLQSCLTLCDVMDLSPPGSSVHGNLQARILEWSAMPSSRGPSWPRDWTHFSYISCIGRRFFTTSATWEAPRSHADQCFSSEFFFSGSQTRLLISFSSLPAHLLPPCPVASLVLNLL